jgi:hypothetical protein
MTIPSLDTFFASMLELIVTKALVIFTTVELLIKVSDQYYPAFLSQAEEQQNGISPNLCKAKANFLLSTQIPILQAS